ncbi:hypothetical protein [Erwinia phage Snitter]|nr:hypothetical protein [Erwinia phage Snitter]
MITEINMERISESQKAELYKAMVVQRLILMGYLHDAFETASSLDMSFEEIKDDNDFILWESRICMDAFDYKKECPERFWIQH